MCCSPRDRKELDTIERLNRTELNQSSLDLSAPKSDSNKHSRLSFACFSKHLHPSRGRPRLGSDPGACLQGGEGRRGRRYDGPTCWPNVELDWLLPSTIPFFCLLFQHCVLPNRPGRLSMGRDCWLAPVHHEEPRAQRGEVTPKMSPRRRRTLDSNPCP